MSVNWFLLSDSGGLTLLTCTKSHSCRVQEAFHHPRSYWWHTVVAWHAILSNILFLTSRSHLQVGHGEEGEEEGEEWEEEREAEGTVDVTQRSYPCIPVGSEF